MSSAQPARGTRDFLPDDVRKREYVVGIIREVYERYGFEPLETPAFENIETLLGKYGEEGNKLIFKILRRGEHEASGTADLALRYDLTVPLARIVALHQHALPKFFRRYQIQPVWRADRPARGRFREFYQCDVDAVGSTSLSVEVELISAVSDVLVRLGFNDFVIRLNHRRALTALLSAAGVTVAQETDALVALDKLDKVGVPGVQAEFAARGIAPEAASVVIGLLEEARSLPNEAWLTRLEAFVGQTDPGRVAVAELTEILRLAAFTPAAGRIRIDPSLARGLSYYTGAIMEVAVPDLAGSLGGGGRYDNLVGMFLGRAVPACGFSLGLERILVVMAERGMFPPTVARAAAEVMVTTWSAGLAGDALALAADLRRAGLRVDVYPDADKPGRQLKYAASRHYHVVAIVGEDEQRRGTVALKNLHTGRQTEVPRAEVALGVTAELQETGKDRE